MNTTSIFQYSRPISLVVMASALALITGCAAPPSSQPLLLSMLGVKNDSAQNNANSHYPTEPPGTPQIQRFDPPPLNHAPPISVGYFLGSSEREWPSTGAVRMMPPREGVADLPTLSGAYNMRVGRTIRCTYGIDGNHRTVYLWDKVRPAIDTRIPREDLNKWRAKRRVTADIAVTICPAKWGDALALVWGQSAWQTLQASAGAERSRLEFQADVAQAVADRRREEALEKERAAAFDKLSDREKCLISRGVKYLDENFEKLTPFGSFQLQLACGKFPRP